MSTPEFPANAVNAPCKREDPELFFPPKDAKPARVNPAKNVCNRGDSGRRCHYFDECLSHALSNKVEGIWAATTEKERNAIREKHGIKADPLSFGSGLTNASAIKRMYRRGTGASDIAERLGVTYEAVRLVIRADEARRAQEGRPIVLDPKIPVPCPGCGSTLLPSSHRKHRREHCTGRQAVSA